MAAGEETDEDPLQHRVLADDDAADLEEDGLGRGSRICRIGQGAKGLRRVDWVMAGTPCWRRLRHPGWPVRGLGSPRFLRVR